MFLSSTVLASHWCHLSVVLTWLSAVVLLTPLHWVSTLHHLLPSLDSPDFALFWVSALLLGSCSTSTGVPCPSLSPLSQHSPRTPRQHLFWAIGFMFLISYLGYWQELVDIALVSHLKSPIVGLVWNGSIFVPTALSIVQARLVGLCHSNERMYISQDPT